MLDVALGMFARQGIVETTLGAIAREAGVTPAMVHYYFKTRDQLLDVLIDERFGPLRTELGQAFTQLATSRPMPCARSPKRWSQPSTSIRGSRRSGSAK